ncbi:MAG: hypothetical protein ACSLFF_09235 [Solirubrobacterales bacterium]
MADPALIEPEAQVPGWRWRDLWFVVALWAIASVLIAVLALGVVTPRRFVDEFLYWGVAKSLAAGTGFSWRGAPTGGGIWLYPVVIAPAFRLANSVASQYEVVKTINAAMICAVAFPVYVAARWFVAQKYAMLAAVFAISVPALNYAGIVSTESLAYPAAAAAFVGMIHALARPGWRSAALAVALTLFALFTRLQFALLLPIFGGTLLLVAMMRGPGERIAFLRAQRALLAMLSGIALLGLVYVLVRGRASLGIYASVTSLELPGVGEIWFWFKAFTADVYLLCAIVPAIATFSLFGSRENRRDPLIGALVALALVATVAFILQMTWFSAVNPLHWRELHIFYERYMFYLGPIFFLGLVASFGRVTWKAAAVSVAVAVVIVSGMQSDAVAVPFSLDAFGQAYLGFLLDSNEGMLPHIGMVLAGLTLVLGLGYVASVAPAGREDLARYGRALAVFLPLFILLISQAKAWSYQQLYSDSARVREPTPLNWVSRATPQQVAMLLPSDADPTTFYETEFWNPNLNRAYVSPVRPIDSHVVYSPTCLFHTGQAGTILPSGAPGCNSVPSAWLVESNSFSMHLQDESKRVHPNTGISSTLMVARAPAQVLSMVGGRNVRDGLVDTSLTVKIWSAKPGRVRIVAKAMRGPVLVKAESGKMYTASPGPSAIFTFATAAGVTSETYKLKRGTGPPNNLKVSAIEYREGNGPWSSIK